MGTWGSIIDNITAIFKQHGNGSNRSILNSVKTSRRLKKATNYSEMINKIIIRNIDKFNKRDRDTLIKYIDKFDSLD